MTYDPCSFCRCPPPEVLRFPACHRGANSRRYTRGGKAGARAQSEDEPHAAAELVIITGMSGSGKASALKAFEDLGYYCVDNLPVELIPRFAELALQSGEIPRTALVVDVREGSQLEKLPAILKSVKRTIPTRVIYLEASDAALLRRYSETRRPHPLGTGTTVRASLGAERRHLRAIRAIADLVIDTSKFNVHELRAHLTDRFKQHSGKPADDSRLLRELRIQTRCAGRCRPGVRRALSAQSSFRARVSCADGTAIRGSRNTSGRFRRPRNSSTASPNCWSTCCRTIFVRARAT